ncbi:uncharacterized protein LOC131242936 [Magnolia sinica]|uniref:uncharacterized protein LOC131242936 n=1 Tax=Magnolia sinica TaxID=86752 RepID=UPI0026580445|nr:uncharacterized protein LOC131242936 [Magnolia sinica]XP_058097905.1 uncharacterized protein LOC131242936 [Magnolia sinica]
MIQCALGKTSSNVEKVLGGGCYTLSKNSFEQNSCKFHLKEPELSTIILRNSDHRWVILTLVTVELDARRKFVAPFVLPLQVSNQKNHLVSGSHVKMEGLNPVYRQPAIMLLDDLQRSQRRNYLLDHTGSWKSFTAISSYGAKFPGQSRNRGSGNKRTKGAKVSADSCLQNHAVSNYSYGTISDGSNATGSSDLAYDISEVDKPNNGSSRKIQEAILEKVDSWSISNDILDSPLTHTAMPVSYSNEVCESETTASLPQDFGEDYSCDPLGVDRSHYQTADVCLSNFIGDVTERHPNQRNDGISFDVSSDGYTHLLDSFSDGWNSDGSTQRSDDVKFQIPVKEDNGISPSNSRIVSEYGNYSSSSDGVAVVRGHFSNGMSCKSNGEMSNSNYRWSKLVVDSENNNDRTKWCSQGHCRGDSHSVISGKRGRRGRNFPGNSSGMHRLSGGVNMHGRTGKENNHSVWQKVQKNDIDGCIYEPKKIDPVHSSLDASKEAPLCRKHDSITRKNYQQKVTRSASLDEMSSQTEEHERVSSVIDSHISSLKSEYGNSRNKASEKLKRKPSTGSKQERCHHPRKGPHTDKSDLVRPTNMNMQQKEKLKPMICRKVFGSGSRSPGYSECQRAYLTDRVDCCSSESLQNSQILLDETKPTGNVCNLVSDIHAPAARNPMNLSSTTSDCSEQTHLPDEQSDYDSTFQKDLLGEPHLPIGSKGNGSTELETDVSNIEHSKQDHNSGSFIQKWVPIQKKDARLLNTSRSHNLPTSHLDEPVEDRWCLKNIEQGLSSSNSYLPFPNPVANDGLASWGSESGLVNCSFPGEEGQQTKLRCHVPSIHNDQSRTRAAFSCCLSHKEKDGESISIFETNLNMLPRVVNDAYRLQIESEGIQLAMCSPLAEFERILHSASPVLERTNSVQNCRTCSGDQLIGDSLCMHQIPNVSLGNFWQWYEGPGSYGLEVKAEEYRNPKRLDSDRFGFCAYFVPFLSAVQLFGRSRCFTCTSNCMLDAAVNTTSENTSDLGDLPILSLLLPRPRREEGAGSSLPGHSSRTSDPSGASGQDEFCNHSVTCACPRDSELLFEYFESEQPHHRRPLFEKIQELIRGDTTSNCQLFGDPAKLDCMHLPDLHPSSWYSVAWYPIYRIPDGNFRAAFLTYHSLGHFIRRSSSLDSLYGDACIVSPVVGLQSYNAQGECWFEPRKSAAVRTEENLHFDPSEILKERLRTLERTASVMARASVRKADQESVNRQPDYEFFVSRRQ